jgi:Zn-dependent peptidase ImmA (M78 family)
MARPAAMARETLGVRGIRDPRDLDLLALLDDHRIAFRRAPIGNAEARIVRSGRHAVITIDHGAFASEKWRFAGAHELGHYRLHEHLTELACFPKKDATRDERSRRFLDEEGASGFAVELLMPASMVAPRLDAAASPLERARALASTFGTSLPTSALRVLDFTDAPCAVVYSERGEIAWCTATRAFDVWVPDGCPLPAGSRAGEAHAARGGVGAEHDVRASVWGRTRGGIEAIREQSVAIPGFDAVITVLWHEQRAEPRADPAGPRAAP